MELFCAGSNVRNEKVSISGENFITQCLFFCSGWIFFIVLSERNKGEKMMGAKEREILPYGNILLSHPRVLNQSRDGYLQAHIVTFPPPVQLSCYMNS